MCFYGCGLIAEHHVVAVLRCREAGVAVRVVACEICITPFLTMISSVFDLSVRATARGMDSLDTVRSACGQLATERIWSFRSC